MEALNDQINPYKAAASAVQARWSAADFEQSWNAEIEKTVRLVSSSRLQREFMRLIPKRRRCKNFSSAAAAAAIESRGREREGRVSSSPPLSENESPPADAAPPHSCIRVMLRAALLIVLRPNPDSRPSL